MLTSVIRLYYVYFTFPDESDPVSTFVTGSHDQTALVWQWNRDTNEVDCRLSCRGHAASVDCVAVAPTGEQVNCLSGHGLAALVFCAGEL